MGIDEVSESEDSVNGVPPMTSPAIPTLPVTKKVERRDIASLLRRMRRNKLMERVRLAYVQETALSPEDCESLCAILGSASDRLWRERVVAAWAFGGTPLNPKQKERVAEVLCDVLEMPPLLTRRFYLKSFFRALTNAFCVATAMAVVCIAGGISLGLFDGSWNSVSIGFWIWMGLWGICSAVGVPLSIVRSSERNDTVRTEAARTLEQLCSPSSVGCLAGALLSGTTLLHEPVAKGLLRTLPLVTEDHYDVFDRRGKYNLYRILGIKGVVPKAVDAEALNLTLLTALEKVGDGGAVPYVERVAAKGWTTELREAAEAILPALRERQRAEEAPGMLLRGSSRPVSSGDQLLRPTTHSKANKVNSEELLRPTDLDN